VVGCGHEKRGRARGDCAAPEVTLTCAATTTWMRGTVIESERSVESGSVTELSQFTGGEVVSGGRDIPQRQRMAFQKDCWLVFIVMGSDNSTIRP